MTAAENQYMRIILVTGSNTGIGYDLVRLLAEKSHTVYLSSRNEAAGKDAQAKLKQEHVLDVKFVQLDITDIALVRVAKEAIEKAEGRLDSLVNNAASPRGYACILNVSTLMASNVTQAAPGSGMHVIAYNTSKVAMNSYSIALAKELEQEDIKVNMISPGFISTKLNSYAPGGKTTAEGASVLVPWALLGPGDTGKTCQFWRGDEQLPW
ncbi:hypothetical protein EDD18DRAFT_1183064 [Armillaria luteobubalina]|uniref:NAD(P)-binding protein n=1 Tax=Armillaria luteobubalina TaxID=153913 RepID=A0AA39UJZ2_9AGAR|nr:hypothetical protein EDD18DRAFT_1183064 [Armillaria luteobubalina]